MVTVDLEVLEAIGTVDAPITIGSMPSLSTTVGCCTVLTLVVLVVTVVVFTDLVTVVGSTISGLLTAVVPEIVALFKSTLG